LRNAEIGIAIFNQKKNEITFLSIWKNEFNLTKKINKKIINSNKKYKFKLKLPNQSKVDDLSRSFFEIFIIREIFIYDSNYRILNNFRKNSVSLKGEYYFDFNRNIVYENYKDYLRENKKFFRFVMISIVGTDFYYYKNDIFKTHINSHFIEYKIILLYKIAHIFKLDKILPFNFRNYIKTILNYVKDEKIESINKL